MLVVEVIKGTPIDLVPDLINGITIAGSGVAQWIKSTNVQDQQNLHDELFKVFRPGNPLCAQF